MRLPPSVSPSPSPDRFHVISLIDIETILRFSIVFENYKIQIKFKFQFDLIIYTKVIAVSSLILPHTILWIWVIFLRIFKMVIIICFSHNYFIFVFITQCGEILINVPYVVLFLFFYINFKWDIMIDIS